MRRFFSPLRLFIIMPLKQLDNAVGKTLTFLFNPMECIPTRFRIGRSACVWSSRVTSDPRSTQEHSSLTWWGWPLSRLQRTGAFNHHPQNTSTTLHPLHSDVSPYSSHFPQATFCYLAGHCPLELHCPVYPRPATSSCPGETTEGARSSTEQ